MGNVRHYSFDEYSITFADVLIQEWEVGDSFEMGLVEDDWKSKQGHHGTVIRSHNPSTIAVGKFVLMPGSPVNAQLQEIADNDIENGQGVGPLIVTDTNGDTTASADKAWLKKRADIKGGTEASAVEWPVEAGDWTPHHGESRLA